MAVRGNDTSPAWLRLWGLADRRLDLALTLLAVTALAVSRLALLASGPWEWDETIFARGMLDFSLAAHFPHPPGFPGLLALGRLLLPLAGEPYRALQLASALASILALWPLAAIGRRVAPPAVASAAALLVLFLPGPWLFAVRGFSTTAAVTPLLAAAALLVGGLGGRRATWFSLLLTASFLIRPILLPTVALLWLIGADGVRPRRRLVPGAVLGAGAVVIAVAVMVHLEGGWAAFIEPFVSHAGYHVDRLYRNTRIIAELGLVTGVGGIASASLLTAASLVGIGVWWRRAGARSALAWIAILGLTTAQLVMLQNRSYARYAVGVQTAAAPLLAGAASLAAPPVAVAGLLGCAVLSARAAVPLLIEQHRETFGPWRATLDAAERSAKLGWAAVVGPEIHVFSSYHWSVLAHRRRATPPMVLTPRAPEPWRGVDRPWLVATAHPELYWPSLTDGRFDYGAVSERLRPLTQRRFLTASVIDNPPLPVGRWWAVEHLVDGRGFMWAGPGAELWLPPVPAATLIGLEIRPAPGDTPLEVEISHGGGRHLLDGRSPARRLWFRTEGRPPSQPVIVRFHRAQGYPPGGGDDRALVAQLLDVRVRPPGARWAGCAATPSERAGLGLELDGAWGGERFDGLGRGVWTAPAARLRLRVDEPGTVTLRLAAPRPTPPESVVSADGVVVAGPLVLDHRESRVTVPVGEAVVERGELMLDLVSVPYLPAADGGSDSRELGIVLLGVDFEPATPSAGWWNVPPAR